MKLAKSTRYALYAALEMACAGDEPVTVADVASRHGLPQTALAKVFQQLVRAGLATSARGIGGGFRLARPRSDVTVLDVIGVFEARHEPGQSALGLGPGVSIAGVPGDGATADSNPADIGLRQLFEEVDELVRCTYASVTLETLARRASGTSLTT